MRIDDVIVRYAIVGTLVLSIDYALLNILLFFGIELVKATSISFISGAITGYIFHRNWTFRYKESGKHVIKLTQFLIIGALGLLATDLIVYTSTAYLSLNPNVSKSIAVIVSALWAYTASRWWVFKQNPHSTTNNERSILVLSPYYPPHTGGLESHAYEFNEHMARAGWTVTVWTSNIPIATLATEVSPAGVTIYRYHAVEIISGFPVPAVWKRSFWLQWKTIRAKHTYSHVISRTRFFLSSILAYFIAKHFKIPHIHIEHGSYYVSQKNRAVNVIAYTYDITIGRFILQQASRVIANSRATSLFVYSLTHTTVKADVIYRGIENKIIQSIPEAIDLREQFPTAVIITYAGRLMGGKGVHDLLLAISRIKTKNRIMCFIVGDGPARASLETLTVRLEISDIVRFLGTCNHERTIGVIKISDIIVNPSYTEGLPTTIIEAALCKKAIIATNVGGTPEIVTHNISAILLQPKNISALSNAINTFILNASMRTSYGIAAEHEAKQKFLWDNAIAKYEQILLSASNR